MSGWGMNPVQMAQVVGNQAVAQMMFGGGLTPRVSRPPEPFSGMLVGGDAASAMDNVISLEDPHWKKIIENQIGRPSFSSTLVKEVWEHAPKNSDGETLCECNPCKVASRVIKWTSETSRLGIWDVGHKPGDEFWSRAFDM